MRALASLALTVLWAGLAAGCSVLPTPAVPAGATVPPAEQARVEAAAQETAPTPATEAPRLTLKSIELERVSELPQETAVSDDMLLAAADGLIGQDVTLDELRGIATGMEAVFRDEGYPYVRVVLPPQRVADGQVKLQVIEGQIEGVVVLGESPTAKRQAEAQLSKLNNLGPVPVASVEEAIAALSDIPGLNANVSLARGTQGPGTMRIIAEAKREEPRFLINMHNWGPEALGREGITGFVRVPGLALYGDEIQASFFTTRDWGEQFVGQLAYERGLTASGLKVRLEGTYGEAEPTGVVATLGATSRSYTGKLEVSHPIYRDRTNLVDLYGGLDYADLKGELFNQTVLLSNDKTRTAYLGAESEFSWDGWSIDTWVEARKGVGIMGASKRGEPNLARPEARPNAWSLLAETNITTPTFQTFRLDLRGMGQHARDPLMAVEEFSFGNYTIIRGYDPGAATGDAAIAGSIELTGLGHRPFNDRTHVEFFGFLDVGEYWNRDQSAVAQHTLASSGVGMRVTVDEYARAEIVYAEPMREPRGQGEGVQSPRVLFSLTTNVGRVAKDAYGAVSGLFGGNGG
ncbi:ShlB/FhaC/HecB family hemolysin secretion/activation protein [Candidatus Phaeomarinobacter ectocarpi]|uniref:ShlB/FhaC/HecB family hemolysin secretion/activation protein n=1 Tax=Candidatus Phaeomarinibacter ectocarpi TaxID=1458461 RepID=UPI001494A5DA|nr:ShlB/FhaC/HecB family hemolysin secretion/activation protein [Candidatus Phaeomarinobacter ectocarpi]